MWRRGRGSDALRVVGGMLLDDRGDGVELDAPEQHPRRRLGWWWVGRRERVREVRNLREQACGCLSSCSESSIESQCEGLDWLPVVDCVISASSCTAVFACSDVDGG